MEKFMPTSNSNIVLVINQNEELISRLCGYAFVSYINHLNDIDKVRNSIQQPSKIHCIVYDDQYSSLSSLEFKSEWKGVPIHLYISGIGDFCRIVPMIQLLRELDIRIFFYATSSKAIVDAQILSSLGVHSGVKLSENQTHWDELNDLMHYAIYGRMSHTPIEPFGYYCNNYNQNDYVDIRGAYFDSPKKFIHITQNEEIALYRNDMLSGKFVAKGIEQLPNIQQNSDYIENSVAWQQHFLKEDGCAYCPAWRICQAYFDQCDDKQKCREVFTELLEGIEFYQSNKQSQKSTNLCQL